MGCFADCCLVSADDYGPAYMRWEDHPSRVDWEVLQDLGAGAFSQVVLARHRRSGRLAALKAVYLDSPDMDAPTAAMLRQEGAILSSLRHPNVVRCAEVIHGERAEVLVLEFLRGGNVLDGLYRLREGGYTERDAADIFAQLAGAVAYLHTRGVVHRDIKPENLVYARALDRAAPPPHDAHHGAPSSSTDPAPAAPSGPVVKLVDLGMALRYDPHDPQVGALGSAGFVAPEIVLGGVHTPAMDVFACGVLLFIMLVGRQPYNQAEAETLRYARLSLGAAPGLRDPRWLDLSPDAKHLLMGMLAFDPRRRLTAAQVAAHEWVATRGGVVLRPLGDDVALGAATVAEMRRLRFICGGVVGAQRRVADAAVAAAAGGKGGAGGEGSGIQGAYLEELRRMQKRGASVHGGLRGVARSIAAKSFRQLHDAGGSVHRSVLEGSVRRSSRGGGGSASAHGGAGAAGERPAGPPPGRGMHRAGTALLLSELLASSAEREGSMRGGGGGGSGGGSGSGSGGGGMRRAASSEGLASQPSGLQLLGASIMHYVDVSVRGGRANKPAGGSANSSAHGSLRSGGAAAAAAAATARLGGKEMAALDGPRSFDLASPRVVQVRPASGGASVRRSLDGGGTVGPRASTDSLDGSSGRRRVHSLKPLDQGQESEEGG